MARKCKVCQSKFEPKYSSVQPTCSIKCTIEYSKILNENKRAKNTKDLNHAYKEKKTKNQKLYLQDEINKLARLIDRRFNFGCIDCNKEVIGVGNGAHYKPVGNNENLRYNLHNIHLARIHCNKHSSTHVKDYYKNLKTRYSLEYQTYLEDGLKEEYPVMHFMSHQIEDALKTTRKIIRDFDKYEINNPILMRDVFNSIIGLYNQSFTK